MNTVPEWKLHLAYYDELEALAFSTKEEFETAMDRLDEDHLRYLPFSLVGNNTMIIPKEAVKYFEDLNFTKEGAGSNKV